MTRLHRLVVSGLAVSGLLFTAVAADAATRTFTDPPDDSGNAVDLRKVIVTYEGKLKVVGTYPGSDLTGSILRYWINTKPKNKGPEYVVVVIPNSDGFGIIKVDTWTENGDSVDCPKFGARADVFAERPRTWISVPATCLGAPKRLAVALQAKKGASSDWVKAPKQFPPFVKRH